MSERPFSFPAGEVSNRRRDRDRGSFWRELPVLVLIALAAALLIKTLVVQAFYIPTGSMQPTLRPGDRVLVDKVSYHLGRIHRGNVVVFGDPTASPPTEHSLSAVVRWLGEGLGVRQPENDDLIKRVIAVEGDTVAIHNDVVYVDGDPIAEPYLTEQARTCNGEYRETEVPQGTVWVLGDNRCNSGDSRFGLGFVPVDDVVGRAFVVVWPVPDVRAL